MYCAFCMPPFFSMPCLFICTSEYRIVYAMSFPSTWKWFWKCQSCLLYSVITCLLFDFIISSASGKLLGEAKHLSEACQLMNCCEKISQFTKESAMCYMCKVSDCSLLRSLPTVLYIIFWNSDIIDSIYCHVTLVFLMRRLLKQQSNEICSSNSCSTKTSWRRYVKYGKMELP